MRTPGVSWTIREKAKCTNRWVGPRTTTVGMPDRVLPILGGLRER